MDDVDIVTQTLNSTIQRYARLAQNYEVEIANLTAEVYRLKAQVAELQGAKEAALAEPESKTK